MTLLKHNDPFDKAKLYMEGATSFLKSQGLAPIPTNYTVAYELASNRNQGLNAAIVEFQSKKQGLDNYILNELFSSFILKSDGKLTEITEPISTLIDEVVNSIEQNGQCTAEFAGTLAENNENINNVNSKEELKLLLGTLATATKKAVANQLEMKEQLKKAELEGIRLRESIDAIAEEAVRDELTGLLNRKGLKNRLRDLSQSEDTQVVTAIMMDIDHFKKVNDTYGHVLGDRVINATGTEINRNVRGRDIAARYGGEEFALLLPGTDEHGAAIVAENIRKSVNLLRWENKRTGEVLPPITISAGVACCRESESYDELLSRADQALYEAKNTGRNKVCISEAKIDETQNTEV